MKKPYPLIILFTLLSGIFVLNESFKKAQIINQSRNIKTLSLHDTLIRLKLPLCADTTL